MSGVSSAGDGPPDEDRARLAAPAGRFEATAGPHQRRRGELLDALRNRDPVEPLVRRGQKNALVPMAGQFLGRFGYLEDHDCPPDLLCPHLSRAVLRFQAFYRLEETGVLNLETLKLMSRPRCGLPDLEPEEIGGAGVGGSDP